MSSVISSIEEYHLVVRAVPQKVHRRNRTDSSLISPRSLSYITRFLSVPPFPLPFRERKISLNLNDDPSGFDFYDSAALYTQRRNSSVKLRGTPDEGAMSGVDLTISKKFARTISAPIILSWNDHWRSMTLTSGDTWISDIPMSILGWRLACDETSMMRLRLERRNDSLDLGCFVEIALLFDQLRVRSKYIEDSRLVRSKHLVFLLFSNSRICFKHRPETKYERQKKERRKDTKTRKFVQKLFSNSSSMIVRKIFLRDQVVASNEAWLEYSIEKSCFQTYNKNILKLILSHISFRKMFFLYIDKVFPNISFFSFFS